MTEKKQLLVIVPAFNESATLAAVLADLRRFGFSQVLVVDDGSADGLGAIAEVAGVAFVRHETNRGQGAAIETGLAFARAHPYEFAATFDADGQHLASDLDVLWAAMGQDPVDVVLGSRFKAGAGNVPFSRRMLLRMGTWVNFAATGLLLSDAHNGLRLFNKKALSAIRLTQARMAHATEIVAEIRKHGLTYREVPVHIQYTPYAMTKGQSAWAGFRILRDLLFPRRHRIRK